MSKTDKPRRGCVFGICQIENFKYIWQCRNKIKKIILYNLIMNMLHLFYFIVFIFIDVTALPEGKWDANLTKVISWNY